MPPIRAPLPIKPNGIGGGTGKVSMIGGFIILIGKKEEEKNVKFKIDDIKKLLKSAKKHLRKRKNNRNGHEFFLRNGCCSNQSSSSHWESFLFQHIIKSITLWTIQRSSGILSGMWLIMFGIDRVTDNHWNTQHKYEKKQILKHSLTGSKMHVIQKINVTLPFL